MGDNWMRASELIAAYGRGKPAQSLEVSGGLELTHKKAAEMTDEELAEIAAGGKK